MKIDFQNHAAPALNALIAQVKDTRPLMSALGKSLEVRLRNHFLAKNAEPNKRGWPKQNFWGRIRKATALTESTETTATVSIADPAFADKVATAGVYRKAAGAYAIPLRREAAGVTPRSGVIPDLFLLRVRGRAFLAKRENAGWSRKNDAGRKRASRKAVAEGKQARLTFYYLLSKTRRHSPDPTALPEEGILGSVLQTVAAEYVMKRGVLE